jgi:hypothetical protein
MSSISVRKRIGISCCLFFCVHKMSCNLAASVVDGVTCYLYVQRKNLNTVAVENLGYRSVGTGLASIVTIC